MKRILVEHNYRKNNGSSLIYGLASTFDAWGNDLDTSPEYFISKKCIDNLGDINSLELLPNIKEASKNNIILKGNFSKATAKKTIYLDQCIILKDIKVLYLTYNSFFSNKNKFIKISLTDNQGNIIADEPNFSYTSTGLMIRNSENYFWGIDFDAYDKIILHIKVYYSAAGDFQYEYDQLLYEKK